MTLRVSFAILFFALLSGAGALTAFCGEPRNPVDLEIEFWEKRLTRDAADSVSPSKLGQAYLQKARESGDLSYLLKAESALKTSLSRRAKDIDAMSWLAYTYCMEHHFKEAIDLAEQVQKDIPDDGFAYGILGDSYLELGDYEKCEANYLKAMEVAPGVFSYSRWANLQYMKGNIPSAIEFYKQALDDVAQKNHGPAHAAWCQVQLGYTYFKIGKFDKAEEYYQDAMKSLPQGVMALEHLAELRGAQGKYDEAAEMYEKALAVAPRPDLYQALGDLYAFAGKKDKAEPLILKAADMYLESVNAGNIHYFHHLAGLYSDSKKVPDEAFRWARRDFVLRQGVYALDCLAWATYVKGDYAEAMKLIKKALAYGIRDAHLYFHASMIYFRADDVEGSKAMVKKATDLNPYYMAFHAHR